MTDKPIISLRGVTKIYGEGATAFQALKGIDLVGTADFTHPEWLDTKYPDPLDIGQTLDDIRRNRNPNEEGIYLAPTHPEVDAHLQNILTELLQNYHLDGIHFDYIRYQDLEWGLNPVGMKYFFQYSGSLPGLPALEVQGKQSFSDFKNAAITQFIHKASRRIKAYQPDCIVSAAVKPNLFKAYEKKFKRNGR